MLKGYEVKHSTPSNPTPLVCSVDEMRAMLGGIGTTKAFDLLRTGAVDSVRIGARRMVKLDSIHRFIANGGTGQNRAANISPLAAGES